MRERIHVRTVRRTDRSGHLDSFSGPIVRASRPLWQEFWQLCPEKSSGSGLLGRYGACLYPSRILSRYPTVEEFYMRVSMLVRTTALLGALVSVAACSDSPVAPPAAANDMRPLAFTAP